nr:acyltransferase [uncultured Carboxylicivirga sp.]
MKNRILELDALRGIAAIMVVLYHYIVRYNGIYTHQNFPSVDSFTIGCQGVQLFFMISGFVILLTLDNVKRPSDFIVSRFARLYPPYWVAIALTYTAVYFFGLQGRQVTFPTAIENLIMFHEYFGIRSVDGVYWTLQVELAFYFWMFLLFLINQLKRIEVFIILGLAFNALITLKLISVDDLVLKFLLYHNLPFFSIGICLYKIKNKSHNQLTINALFLSLLSTVLWASSDYVTLYVFFTIIFYLGINGKLSILRSKLLVFLGTISYSLYLLHQNIGYIIINKGYELNFNPVFSVVMAVLIMIFVAYLSYKFVERPSVKLIKKFYNSYSNRAKLADATR